MPTKTKLSFTVKTAVTLDEEMVKSLLCCATEGGSNYWAIIEGYNLAKGVKLSDFEYPHFEVPFRSGCSIEFSIDPHVDHDDGIYELDLANMEGGLQVMADKYPHHWKNVINDNADAETGDVFLQCSLFGDIIFS